MKWKFTWFVQTTLVVLLGFTLVTAGCSLFGGDEEIPQSAIGRSIADEIGTELGETTDLSDDQIEAITSSAISAIESDLAEADLENLDTVLPKAVEGAQEGLGGIGDTDMTDDRGDVVDSIVAASIGSISTQSSTSRQALSTDDVVSLIQAVSDAAVSALDEAGFETDDIPDAVKNAVGSAVANMGRSGIAREGVEDALSGISSGAAKSVKNTGATSDTVGDLLNKASRGAASSVENVNVSGFDPESEFGRVVGLVARGVAGALDEIDIEGADMETMIGAVTEGATDAIQDVGFSLDAAAIGNAVRSISAGASSALSDLESGVTDASVLVKKVAKSATEAASRIASAKFLSDDDLSTLVSSAAAGTAEGATESGQVDTEQLLTMISDSLAELSTQLAALQASLDTLLSSAVSEGILAGRNTGPVAVATANPTSFTLGTEGGISLDATGSSDADGDTLTYSWEILLPAGTGGIQDPEAASTTFIPAVAGDYLIILTVSDGTEDDDSFLSIAVSEPTVDTTGTLTDEDKQTILDLAIGYMTAGNLEQASSKFNTLVTDDPDYMPGVMGAVMMDFVSISKEADVQAFAKDVLGFTQYPSTMNELFDPESWMQEFYVTRWDGWYEDTWSMMFPFVDGQSDGNGDGVVDMSERMVAMVENIMDYYADTTTSTQTEVDMFLDFIIDRITNAEAMIDALSEDASFTLTWDMLQWSVWADAKNDGWPYTKNTAGTAVPVTFTIGKAELQTILASFKLLETWAYFVKTFDFSLDFTGITLNPDAAEGEFYVDFNGWQPLSGTFTDESAGADAAMTSAKTAMNSALDTLTAAVTEIQDRTGSTFTIASGSPWVDGTTTIYEYRDWEEYNSETDTYEVVGETEFGLGITWLDVDTVLNFWQIFLGKIKTSVNDATKPFIYPTDFMTYDGPLQYMDNYSIEGTWPTEASLYFTTDTRSWEEEEYNNTTESWEWVTYTEEYQKINVDAVAMNLGGLFSGPLGGLSAWFAMNADGEPKFYTTSDDGATWTQATTWDGTKDYYIKFPDITFGDIIPRENIPVEGLSGVNDVTTPNVYFVDSSDNTTVAEYVQIGAGEVGHSLVAAGTEFTYNDWYDDYDGVWETETDISTGSFWTGLAYNAIYHNTPEIEGIDSDDYWQEVWDDENNHVGTGPTVYIYPGQTKQLRVYLRDWNGNTYRPPYDGLVFTSHNTDIATVDSSTGVVTGVAAGIAGIEAVYTDPDSGHTENLSCFVVVQSAATGDTTQ